MIVMLSNQTGYYVGVLAERYPGLLGHLFTPGKSQFGPYAEMPYALDNGAYAAWENGTPWSEDEWRFLMRWAALSGKLPLWAVVPDVVGDRLATLALWAKYSAEVRAFGFRPAFALQDGMTFDDVPDDDCMLFIGGLDEWKDAAIVPWCARFPGRVHVARVNSWDRLMVCHRAGAASIDGTRWFQKKQARTLSQFGQLVRYLEHAKGAT